MYYTMLRLLLGPAYISHSILITSIWSCTSGMIRNNNSFHWPSLNCPLPSIALPYRIVPSNTIPFISFITSILFINILLLYELLLTSNYPLSTFITCYDLTQLCYMPQLWTKIAHWISAARIIIYIYKSFEKHIRLTTTIQKRR